jgi:hypothetical protein
LTACSRVLSAVNCSNPTPLTHITYHGPGQAVNSRVVHRSNALTKGHYGSDFKCEQRERDTRDFKRMG